MNISREDIVAAARAQLGVRFKRLGRASHVGLDCVGLVVTVGRNLGLEIEDKFGYDFSPKPDEFMLHTRSQTQSAPFAPRHGAIAILRQAVYPMHLGIFAKTPTGFTIINASMTSRKVVEEPFENWRNLLLEVRDYKGVL